MQLLQGNSKSNTEISDTISSLLQIDVFAGTVLHKVNRQRKGSAKIGQSEILTA